MDYTTGTDTWKYQWDLIHDPDNLLLAFLQDEEDGAMYKSLEADYDYSNIGGHNEILQYLINNKRDEMISKLEISEYFDYKDETTAAGIIEDVLGSAVVLDLIEAQIFLEEFYTCYFYEEVAEYNDEILNEVLNLASFTEDDFYQILYTKIGYVNSSVTSFGSIYEYYKNMYGIYNGFDLKEISTFKTQLLDCLASGSAKYSYTDDGLRELFTTLSNTQFKKFYRSKFANVTNAEMKALMEARKAGNLAYNDIIKLLTTSDKIELTNSLDEFSLFSMRNTKNFIANRVDLNTAITVTGNVLTVLQLFFAIKGDLDVSPMDVFAVIPHPIGLLAIVGDQYVSDMVEDFNQIGWDSADYLTIIEWNDKWRGEPGLNDESLYLYYTDQESKYNPDIQPTSIVITNQELAKTIMGFETSIVDCDYKSVMFNGETGNKNLNQVMIGW